MNIERAVTVANAASKLGVNPSRVRAMIDARLLDAMKVGNRWFIDPVSVNRRQSSVRPTGRQLTPRNAWISILLLAREENREASELMKQQSPWMLSRIRSRVATRSLCAIAPRLRGRATTHRFHGHSSALNRILAEAGVVRGGISAAANYSADIIARGAIEAYIPSKDLSSLINKYSLEPSSNPNVILHTIEGLWPFAKSTKAVPPLVVALDLLESEDERTARAGKGLLERLDKQL